MSAPARRILSSGKWFLAALLAAVFLQAQQAQAHLLNMSNVHVALVGKQRVVVTAELDLTRTFGSSEAYFRASQVPRPADDAAIAGALASAADAIELRAGDAPIVLTATAIEFEKLPRSDYLSTLQWPRATMTLTGALPEDASPVDDGIRIRFSDTFIFEEPIATTLQSDVDQATTSRWLVTFQSSPVLKAPLWFAIAGLAESEARSAAASPVFAEYAKLGFWHIVPDGIDHLLFVLALVLAARTARTLLVVLSLYTLAHSLSFAAAALGWLPTAMLRVEPLIILSILVTALLNLRDRAASSSAALLVFGFGLLHGLGFANALAGSGLPTEQRLVSLLGFNLGVEAAQLLWVALLLPIWWCQRYPWFGSRVRKPLSVGIAVIALWWLISR